MEKSVLQLWEEYCESAHAKSIDSPYIIVSEELSKKIREINGRIRKRDRSLLGSGHKSNISRDHKDQSTN